MKIIFILFFYHVILIISGLYFCFGFSNCLFDQCPSIWLKAILFGLVGGCTYCIRGLYLQYCVKKEWDNRWIVWHIIRPFVSAICGAISLLLVKAGLLLFAVSHTNLQSHYGIYALAFVAGLNVDNFIKKIESIFKELIGINKTNVSERK